MSKRRRRKNRRLNSKKRAIKRQRKAEKKALQPPKDPTKNKHHRKPVAQGGTKTYPEGNIIILDKKLHFFWHQLFPGDMTASQICEIINRFFLDPQYVFTCYRRKED